MLKNVRDFLIRYQFLWRLLFSLLIFLCLPMIIINWYTIRRSYNTLEARSRGEHLNVVNEFNSYFNAQLNKMYGCGVDLSVYKRITSEMTDNNRYTPDAIKQMVNYRNNVPMASDCFLYFYGCDYVVGSNYAHQKQHFYHYLSKRESDFSEALNAIFSGEEITFLPIYYPTGNVNSGILVSINASVAEQNDAVMLFHISRDSLISAFFGYAATNESELYIFDGDGQLIFPDCSSTVPILQSAEVSAFLSDHSQTSLDISSDGADYCLFRRYDSALDLSFAELIPRSALLSDVDPIYQSMRLFALLSTVFILLMLALVIYLNYKPILTLLQRVFPNRKSRPPVSETAEIVRYLDQAADEKYVLEELMEDRTRHLSQHILSGFLEGRELTPHEAAILGLDSSSGMFCCFSLKSPALDTDCCDEICSELRSSFLCSTFVSQNLYDRCVTFLCAYPEFDGKTAVETAEAICRMIGKLLSDDHFRLGAGSPGGDLASVKNCYLSSLIAMEQGEDGCVNFYEDSLRDFSTLDRYPSEAVLRFVYLVKQGDHKAASEALSEVVSHIDSDIPSAMFERYVCYDVINVLIKSLAKSSIRIPEAQVNLLVNFSNLSDFEAQMLSVTRTVCEEIAKRRSGSEKEMMESVRAFVEDNLYDPDLSRTMIADKFQLSNSATSELINSLFQCTLREYIVSRRIERSKELLILDEDKSVNDIALEVGFRDPSYYIRVFKKLTGSTPHAFRSAQRPDGD